MNLLRPFSPLTPRILFLFSIYWIILLAAVNFKKITKNVLEEPRQWVKMGHNIKGKVYTISRYPGLLEERRVFNNRRSQDPPQDSL